MINKDNHPATSQDTNRDEKFSDAKTKLKIHKHLADVNDQISDQDIKNVRTDFKEEPTEHVTPVVAAGESENDKNDPDHPTHTEDKEKEEEVIPVITPWNILGS